jgi:hypothetical protein
MSADHAAPPTTSVEELYIIQATAIDLHLQLDNLKTQIAKLETFWNPLVLAEPSKRAHSTAAASAIWRAAGLEKTVELEQAIRGLEDWIFLQPDWEVRVAQAGGWLNFLYSVLEVPIRKACNGRMMLG